MNLIEYTYAYCILNCSRLCERINDTRLHISAIIILFSYATNWFANIMQVLSSTVTYCSKCVINIYIASLHNNFTFLLV